MKQKTEIHCYGVRNPKGNLLLTSLALSKAAAKKRVIGCTTLKEEAMHAAWIRRIAQGYDVVKVKIIEE